MSFLYLQIHQCEPGLLTNTRHCAADDFRKIVQDGLSLLPSTGKEQEIVSSLDANQLKKKPGTLNDAVGALLKNEIKEIYSNGHVAAEIKLENRSDKNDSLSNAAKYHGCAEDILKLCSPETLTNCVTNEISSQNTSLLTIPRVINNRLVNNDFEATKLQTTPTQCLNEIKANDAPMGQLLLTTGQTQESAALRFGGLDLQTPQTKLMRGMLVNNMTLPVGFGNFWNKQLLVTPSDNSLMSLVKHSVSDFESTVDNDATSNVNVVNNNSEVDETIETQYQYTLGELDETSDSKSDSSDPKRKGAISPSGNTAPYIQNKFAAPGSSATPNGTHRHSFLHSLMFPDDYSQNISNLSEQNSSFSTDTAEENHEDVKLSSRRSRKRKSSVPQKIVREDI